MTIQNNDEAAFRRSLLTSPGERQLVEYKSAVAFSGNMEFGLKLIRHILGMANTGGGWIVIGYDDETLQPDPKHSSEITATYDSTTLSDVVNKSVHKGQQVHVTVFKEPHPITQNQHPIIAVEGFERTPFVCRSERVASDTKRTVLQSGKVYIRRPGAATSEIINPSDWEDLLKRCVAQRRGEFLSEFADLVHRMNNGDATHKVDNSALLDEWMEQQWPTSTTYEHLIEGGGYVEAGSMLVDSPDLEWSLKDIRTAALSAVPRYANLLVARQGGVEARLEPPIYEPEHWVVGLTGHTFRTIGLAEDYTKPAFNSSDGHPPKWLWIRFAIERIATILLESSKLYSYLGIPPNQPYLLKIAHRGIKDRVLYSYNFEFMYYIHQRLVSIEDNSEWQEEVTQDLVNSQSVELTHKIANRLFTLFEFAEIHKDSVAKIIEEYTRIYP